MLSDEQLTQFERDGIVKVPGAFSPDDAAHMRDVLWANLSRRFGLMRDDPSTWQGPPPSGFRSLRRHRAFAPTQGRFLSGALDDLLGLGQWVPPKHFGQVLVTLPNAAEWQVPHALWHADFEYTLPSDVLVGVKYWALLDDVAPGGGGTAQLLGSHRLMRRYLQTRDPADREYKSVRDGFMRSHPWLRDLTRPAGQSDRTERFMSEGIDIDGITLKVMECTGSPGDIYLTHPWVMHTIAPNAGDRPRLMRTMAVYRRGCLDAGFGADEDGA